MKCTDQLVQEHKVILRCLDVLEEMARRVEKAEPPPEVDLKSLLHFLHVFADDHHQMMEESALFPELMQTANVEGSPLRHMIFEHDQERSLVEGLQEALFTKKGSEFVHFANRLIALIRNHIWKEDNILFEIVERCLSAQQDEKVAAEFNKFQVDVGYLVELRRLEWKYLRKAA